MSATQAGAGIITQLAGGLKACFVNATALYDRVTGAPKKEIGLDDIMDKKLQAMSSETAKQNAQPQAKK